MLALLAAVGIGNAAGTLRDLAPIAVAIAQTHALVTYDAAQETFAFAAMEVFRKLGPPVGGRRRRCGCDGRLSSRKRRAPSFE